MAKTDFDVKSLANEVQKAIAGLRESGQEQSSGVVTRIGDGVAWIYGLRSCGYSEMIEIEADNGGYVSAFALNLLEDEIGAVLLGEDQFVKAGARVRLTGQILSVPVGPEMLGRVLRLKPAAKLSAPHLA
jgi:F0F1-type ATP synthase alpha subunit